MEKLTAQIASAYYGCQVQNFYHKKSSDKKIVGDMRGIIKDYLLIENYDVFGKSRGKPVNQPIVDCQLILKPLSSISDEDAIEVAKICGVSECWQSGKGIIKLLIIENDKLTLKTSIALIDFLRSKSYDLGFGNIPSLITAGIAITTKSN